MTATIFAAPFVWLGALLAGVQARRRGGTQFGEVALGAAIAGTVTWSAMPNALASTPGLIGLSIGMAGVLIAAWMILRLRRIERARAMHVCLTCNYDLTGNESGICPECGTVTVEGERRVKAARAAEAADAVSQLVVEERDA